MCARMYVRVCIHTAETGRKIVVLCVLIFTFFKEMGQQNTSEPINPLKPEVHVNFS
jgi:hypothetical protein